MRLRFTIRRLLLMVALIAFLLTGYLTVQRLRTRAWVRQIGARLESDLAERYREKATMPWTSEARRKAHMKAAAWHDQRAALYRYSVWRPWYEVPDVPEPSFGADESSPVGWRARAYASGIRGAAGLVARVRRQRAEKATVQAGEAGPIP